MVLGDMVTARRWGVDIPWGVMFLAARNRAQGDNLTALAVVDHTASSLRTGVGLRWGFRYELGLPATVEVYQRQHQRFAGGPATHPILGWTLVPITATNMSEWVADTQGEGYWDGDALVVSGRCLLQLSRPVVHVGVSVASGTPHLTEAEAFNNPQLLDEFRTPGSRANRRRRRDRPGSCCRAIASPPS